MAESFENLDNILGDWANTDKYVLPRHWTGSKCRKRKDVPSLKEPSHGILTIDKIIVKLKETLKYTLQR